MLISEIKDKALRELAELRAKEGCYYDSRDKELFECFSWAYTTEGYIFWDDVDEGKITEPPNDNRQ
jgi:hypothetical protein